MLRDAKLLKVAVAFIYLLLLAPIVVVVGVSFNPTSSYSVPLGELSLRWYRTFFTTPAFTESLFKVSLPVAVASSFLATVVGTLAAIVIVRFRFVARETLEAIFMLPLLIPSVLLGAALYLFFSRLNMGGGYTAMIAGHMLIGIPYVIRVVAAGLVGINPALEEAAINLGCSPTEAFFKVVLPLLRSSLVSGAIFAFIVSFSDINVAMFIAGPSTATLPLHIYSEIQWQGAPTIAAASTISILAVLVLILIVQRFFRVRLVF
jgi:putative spermidine/putrescine transport system permease protein